MFSRILSARHVVASCVALLVAGCASDGYPGWTREERVEVKGVVTEVIPIADAGSRFWPVSREPVAVLVIRPRSIVPTTPELLIDGDLRISVGGAADYSFVQGEWFHKKVYLRIFRSYERRTGEVGFRFNEVRTVDDIMPGYASEQRDAEDAAKRAMEKKAAEPGATDNPDDAQRLREDH